MPPPQGSLPDFTPARNATPHSNARAPPLCLSKLFLLGFPAHLYLQPSDWLIDSEAALQNSTLHPGSATTWKPALINSLSHGTPNQGLAVRTAVYSMVLVTQSCPTLCYLWTVARQAPLSMGFPRQEYWSGLPFPSPYGV